MSVGAKQGDGSACDETSCGNCRVRQAIIHYGNAAGPWYCLNCGARNVYAGDGEASRCTALAAAAAALGRLLTT